MSDELMNVNEIVAGKIITCNSKCETEVGISCFIGRVIVTINSGLMYAHSINGPKD